jgi:catechol 2,3-dioxygenase-like lactoylglutathione lyase family enzyme
MLEAIHHVALICSDYERSKRFYSHILGLPIIREVWRAERHPGSATFGSAPPRSSFSHSLTRRRDRQDRKHAAFVTSPSG